MNRMYNNKGIILISTLLLISVIIMIVALLVVTGKNTMLLGGNYSEKERALYAAECGITYVQLCISKYIDWKCNETVLNGLYNPGLDDVAICMVNGQRNCIRGIIKKTDAEFYVSFYDGAWNSSDARFDLKGNPLKYYSVNNLSNSTNTVDSILFDGITAKTYRTVPKLTAHIISEGRCNRAKRYVESMLVYDTTNAGSACSISAGGINIDLSDNDSSALVNTSNSSESKIRSMGDIKITSPDPAKKNSFQIANNGLSCTGKPYERKYTYINGKMIDSIEKQKEYGLSCDNTNQSGFMQNARLNWTDVTKDYIYSVAHPEYHEETKYREVYEDEYDDKGKKKGTKVRTESYTETYVTYTYTTHYNDNIKAKLASGSWVYKNSPDNPGEYKLFYYPDEIKKINARDFVNINKRGETVFNKDLIQGNKSAISIIDKITDMHKFSTGSDSLFTIKDAIGVNPEYNKGFSVAIYDYDPSSKATEPKFYPSANYRASVKLEKDPSNPKSNPCLLTNTGFNVNIEGELSGQGKVITGGSLSFQGNSILSAGEDHGISIYSQGSVYINPMTGTGGSSDPNSIIKKAFKTYINENGLKSEAGYYKTDTKDYSKLRDNILETVVSKSGSQPKTLNDILTDKDGLNYSTANAQELVNMMLVKNSYKGEDNSTSKTNEVIMDYENSYNYGNYQVTCSHGIKSDKAYIKVLDQKSQKMDIYVINAGTVNNGKSTPISPGDIPGISSNTWSLLGETILDKSNFSTEESSENWQGDFSLSFNNSDDKIMFNLKDDKWVFKYDTAGRNLKSDTVSIVDPDSQSFRSVTLSDTIIKGLIYTWEDLIGNNLQGGTFTIRGGIVAFGGNPAYQNPGDNTKGKIILNKAKYVTFTYDPNFMHMVFDTIKGINTKKIFSASF